VLVRQQQGQELALLVTVDSHLTHVVYQLVQTVGDLG
jgi:hypothetical protein